MGNDLTASLISVNWLESRHQDPFNCQPAEETPFPCVGEVGDRYWHILLGFQHRSLKESSAGVKLSSGKSVLPWHRWSERFLSGLQWEQLNIFTWGNCCLWWPCPDWVTSGCKMVIYYLSYGAFWEGVKIAVGCGVDNRSGTHRKTVETTPQRSLPGHIVPVYIH